MNTRKKTTPAPKSTTLGRQLISGMKAVEKHLKGEIELPERRYQIPDLVNVKAIRERFGLTQEEFAQRFGISQRSLQEWEQGRRQPEGAVRSYLRVIESNPKAVEEALGSHR